VLGPAKRPPFFNQPPFPLFIFFFSLFWGGSLLTDAAPTTPSGESLLFPPHLPLCRPAHILAGEEARKKRRGVPPFPFFFFFSPPLSSLAAGGSKTLNSGGGAGLRRAEVEFPFFPPPVFSFFFLSFFVPGACPSACGAGGRLYPTLLCPSPPYPVPLHASHGRKRKEGSKGRGTVTHSKCPFPFSPLSPFFPFLPPEGHDDNLFAAWKNATLPFFFSRPCRNRRKRGLFRH